MARITVLGGTGYGGEAVVREAARRGHAVTSYSRRPPEQPVDGVTYVTGSLLDPELLAQSVRDADVVFEALSPRGDMVGKVEGIVDDLIRLADEAGVRLGVLGGASSMLVSEGGPRLFDTAETPPEILPEVQTGLDVLETLTVRTRDARLVLREPGRVVRRVGGRARHRGLPAQRRRPAHRRERGVDDLRRRPRRGRRRRGRAAALPPPPLPRRPLSSLSPEKAPGGALAPRDGVASPVRATVACAPSLRGRAAASRSPRLRSPCPRRPRCDDSARRLPVGPRRAVAP